MLCETIKATVLATVDNADHRWDVLTACSIKAGTPALTAVAGLDDQILGMALGIVVILANVRYQWNRHLWDVEFTMFQSASIVALATKLLFTLAGSFARASLICFYFRLMKDTGYSIFKYVLWAAFVYNIAIGVTFVILAVFLCSPIEAYWVFPMIKGARCLDEGPVTLTAGVLNCISDLTVTLLPIPIIMGLNMP
ncbi:hypothetical protein KCV02_g4314, partial [Aureobasidium melanogenum]